MKKSKIFIAAGGLIIALVGVLTTKANKKFAQYSVAYIKGSTTNSVTISNFFTTNNTRPQVKLSIGGFIFTLVSSTLPGAANAYKF